MHEQRLACVETNRPKCVDRDRSWCTFTVDLPPWIVRSPPAKGSFACNRSSHLAFFGWISTLDRPGPVARCVARHLLRSLQHSMNKPRPIVSLTASLTVGL